MPRPRPPHPRNHSTRARLHPAMMLIAVSFALLKVESGRSAPSPSRSVHAERCVHAVQEKRWDVVVSSCEKMITEVTRYPGSEDINMARWFGWLARGLFELEKYDESESYAIRGLRILENKLGPHHPELAHELNRISGLYRAMGNYAEAMKYAQRSLNILENARGPFHNELKYPLNTITVILHDQGFCDKALPYILRSLDIGKRSIPVGKSIVTSLHNLALIYSCLGDNAKAEDIYLQILRMLDQAGDYESLDTATATMLNLADLYLERGVYDKAEAMYLLSQNNRLKLLGPYHPKLAQVYNHFAELYIQTGRYLDAEKLLLRSLKVKNHLSKSNNLGTAKTMNDLAVLYYIIGHEEKAEHLYMQGIQIFQSALGTEHEKTVTLRRNLVDLMLTSSTPEKALGLLQNLLDHDLQKAGLFSDRTLITFRRIARVQKHLGLTTELEKIWDRFSAELFKSRLPIQNLSTNARYHLSVLLERMFFYFWTNRRFNEADKLISQLRELISPNEQFLNVGTSRMSEQLRAASSAERRLLQARAGFSGGLDDAHSLGLLEHGVDAVLRYCVPEALRFLRDGLYLGEEHLRRQKSVKAVADWLSRLRPYLRLIFDLSRTQPQDLDALRLAWTATLLTKGRTLDAETRALRVLHDPKVALQNPMLWRMQQDVKNRVRQGAVTGTGGGELQALGQQAREMEAALSQSMDAARIEALPEPFEIVRAVAAELPKDGVLVDFVEYTPPQLGKEEPEARYLALLMFPSAEGNEPRLQLLDLGEVKAHGPRIAELLKALRDPSSQPQKAARAVYDALLDPVRKAAGTATQLWLVPDGALNLIPFDALHDGQGYVLDSPLRIRYLASGRDLVFSFGASSAQPPLVLGNPALHAATAPSAPTAPASTAPKTAAVSLAKKQRGSDARGGSLFDALPDLPDLPDAEQEARTVAAQLQVAALLGAQASEPALRGKIARGQVPRILHLAMHGVFPDDLLGTTAFGARARSVPVPFAPGVLPPPSAAPAPPPAAADVSPALDEPMLQSALVLAGAAKARDATDAKSDGILTADEARELPLEGAELVVLSACQTALGSIRAGDGVYGLRRAFLAAGAEAVVASLWRVADRQTHSLMNKYYDLLITQRTPRITAMRDAMREIKKTNPHPYYWAPFIAIGRDEPIRPLDLHTAQQP